MSTITMSGHPDSDLSRYLQGKEGERHTPDTGKVRVGSAKAAFESFKRAEEPAFRPEGDLGADDVLDEGAPGAETQRKVFGMKVKDLYVVGAAVVATVAAATFGAPILAAGAAVAAVCLVIDAVGHRNDQSTLLDRPGSVIKALVWAGASVLTLGVGLKVGLVVMAASVIAEVAVKDSGETRLNGDEIKYGLAALAKDAWFWLKAVAIAIILVFVRRETSRSGSRASVSDDGMVHRGSTVLQVLKQKIIKR